MKLKHDVEQTLQIWAKEYKKGFTAYILLTLLLERPMYGYEMKQILEERAENKVLFKESAIYQLLKSMRKHNFVESFWDTSPLGPKRKYYRLTDTGRTLLQAFTSECIQPMNKLLNIALENGSKAFKQSMNKENR